MADALFGLAGDDTLRAREGPYCLSGGGGKDKVNCGPGKDKVTVDAKDKVSASCEKVVERA